MTYSVKQLADYLNVSNTTIRTSWSGEFADHLSENTRPPKGQERRFTEDDFSVLQTVAILRNQGIDYADIHDQLNQGIRLEPEEGKMRPNSAENEPITAVTVDAFQTALSNYETRLGRLEAKLDTAQEARIAAEIRAAAAEAELNVLKTLREETAAPVPVSFWDRIRGRV